MKRLESSSALNHASAWPAAEGEPRGLTFLSDAARDSAAAAWVLAIGSLAFAIVAANLLCLSPRWYSNRFISLVYEPVRFVVLTAAVGAVAVQIFWEIINNPPSAGRLAVARSLSGGWVFLPCFVLLYERNSPWMLVVITLVTLGTAFGLRRILPAAAEPNPLPGPSLSVLPSLDGLPPADSPLQLAFWIAICVEASVLLAANDSLLLAAYALAAGVFLFAWRWTASQPRAAQWWIGKHPPLRQATVAILLTSFTLIPFSFGGSIGLLGGRRPSSHPPPDSKAEANFGYYGIILYPPPHKKEIIAPVPHTNPMLAGAITKPTTIPFDGQYWYFKAPNRRPDEKAHIAHGKPIDANINPRSTDRDPLLMEAHQSLSEPIDLACCGELDVAITNADTRPGEIALLALLRSSTSAGKFFQTLGQQTIASSQLEHIPANRAPIKEILRFRIPPSRTPRRFDEITILFMPTYQHSRTGAKVSIDSFELLPKP